jgi:hypothetical protein
VDFTNPLLGEDPEEMLRRLRLSRRFSFLPAANQERPTCGIGLLPHRNEAVVEKRVLQARRVSG